MNAMLAVLGLSGTELIIVLVAILVLFGAKRIPEFAKGLGKGINEFKKASREVTDSLETDSTTTTTAPKAPPANTTAQVTAQVPVQSKPPETKVV
jgi:sec-independent protein translocase protein TatA